MTMIVKPPLSRQPLLRRMAFKTGLILGLTLMTLAAPAFAAGPPRHVVGHGPVGHRVDRDWNRHEVIARNHWHGPHAIAEPGIVYAPPVVYAPPPPVESPGLNLVIPLNFH
jgi:hypothetical protein